MSTCKNLNPDHALMAINTLIRAVAQESDISLREQSIHALASLANGETASLAVDTAFTAISDTAPVVRRGAFIALTKLQTLVPSARSRLLSEAYNRIQNDTPYVATGAIYAIYELLPESLDNLPFQAICRILDRLDQWGQTIALQIIGLYADLYIQEDESDEEETIETELDTIEPVGFLEMIDGLGNESKPKIEHKITSDLSALRKSVGLILNSITPSVASQAALILIKYSKQMDKTKPVKRLISMLYSDDSIAHAASQILLSISGKYPSILSQYINHFYVTESDPFSVKINKIQTLARLAMSSNCEQILRELSNHIQSIVLSSFTISAIGSIAGIDESGRAVALLVRQIPAKQAALALAKLAKRGNTDSIAIEKKLLSTFETLQDPDAKTEIIYSVCELCEDIPLEALEILRQIAVSFSLQPRNVKFAAISLVSRLLSIRREESETLGRYLLTLAFYDQDVSLRDYARLMNSLLNAETVHPDIELLRTSEENQIFTHSLREKDLPVTDTILKAKQRPPREEIHVEEEETAFEEEDDGIESFFD